MFAWETPKLQHFKCKLTSCENKMLKVNLHSIRFLSVFLRFCFSVKKYGLFHPNFYKSISALITVNYYVYIKNFVRKFCVWTIRAIFQNRAVSLYKKFFWKTFVQYVTDWLVWIWTYKNADEKAHTFSRRSKNVQKLTKNGYCLNSPSNIR